MFGVYHNYDDNSSIQFYYFFSSDKHNQTLYGDEADGLSLEALKQLRWVIAGLTFGIFVLVTIGIAVSHYIATKRIERRR